MNSPGGTAIYFSHKLTYAVYLWPVHCECAMKHNRRQIFNYLQIRDTCTACKGSCGNVMLSQASVCPQLLIGGGEGFRQHQMHPGIGYIVGCPWTHPLLEIRPGDLASNLDIKPCDLPLPVTYDGDHWRPVQTFSFDGHPLFPNRHLVVATEAEARIVSEEVIYTYPNGVLSFCLFFQTINL